MEYKKIHGVLLPLIALELITLCALLKMDLGHLLGPFPTDDVIVENYKAQILLSAARITCGVSLFSIVTLAILIARKGRAIRE